MTRDLSALTSLAAMIRERALADYAAASRVRRDLEDQRRTLAVAASAAPMLDPGAANVLAAARSEAHAKWAAGRAAALTPMLARAAAEAEAGRLRAARALGRTQVIEALSKR